MLNFKKITSFALAGCIVLSAMMMTAGAVDMPAISEQAIPGEVMQFTSVDDETGLVDNIRIEPKKTSGIIWSSTWYEGSGVKVVETATATDDKTTRKEFVRYLTGSWAQASSYTWSKSNTASWTVSSGANMTAANGVATSLGLSTSRTTSYSVGITINADSSRFSKLAFCSDFFRQYYTYKMTVNGAVTKTSNDSIKTPMKDTYLIVYYQK